MICDSCKCTSSSWIHCKKGILVCDKCCKDCKYLDKRTSLFICKYK
jgi:hypothetical protein